MNTKKCGEDLLNIYMSGNETDAKSQYQADIKFSDKFFAPLKKKEFYSRCGFSPDGPELFYDFVSEMIDFDTSNW